MGAEYIPIRSEEAPELEILWACRQALDDAEKPVEKRLRACKRWRQYRTVQRWMANITNDLMLTVEPRKAQTFLVNLKHKEIRVVSKGRTHNTPDYTLVPVDVLRDIVLQAMKDTCMLCDGAGCDMARCKFRKPLKQVFLFDVDESGGICMGHTLLKKFMEDNHES